MLSRSYDIEELGQRARELRLEPTLAEDKLWQALRRKALGVKFRRQVPLGRYILDFVSLKAQLVIEVDGSQHMDSPYDLERDEWLQARGFTVLRFWNNTVMTDMPIVMARIEQELPHTRNAPAP